VNLRSASNEHSAGERAVSVRDLTLTYVTTVERKPTFRQALTQSGRKKREVRALRGINLEIPYGRVLGVIGSNGAGKSSLMRVISGIIPPTSGQVEVEGKVSTLLALGVGFNSRLTGRENVILGGLAAGLTRHEIQEQFDEIATFAEIGDAIDSPMKTYSSGMYSRLAFAVSVVVEPDILIIDEALSAGDAKFKKKCLERIKSLRSHNRAIIIVSHALGTVKDICNDVVWLNQGEIKMRGKPGQVIGAYKGSLQVAASPAADEDV
jgi:teichoic acid transport system ATP-binding protein